MLAPMGDWVDALDAGPLAAVARRFAGDPLPRGPAAIEWLLAYLPRHLDEGEDDDEFIEGAGALLGVVLLDHHGGHHVVRGHRHRLTLGRFGSFDPFALAESLLDADDPHARLAEELRLAESEAAGVGPMARVVRAFAVALEAMRPELAIASRVGLALALSDGVEVDLRRVAVASDGEDDAVVARSAEKLVRLLPGGEADAPMPFVEAAELLRPRLVAADFADELPGLFTHPLPARFGTELIRVALQLAFEGRSRFVRQREVDAWRDAQPLLVAIENLAARSADARFVRVDSEDGVLVVAGSGDGLDAARLLLPTLEDVLRAELAGPILVSVPHRDTLLASDSEALLRARTDDAHARAPHKIATALLRL